MLLAACSFQLLLLQGERLAAMEDSSKSKHRRPGRCRKINEKASNKRKEFESTESKRKVIDDFEELSPSTPAKRIKSTSCSFLDEMRARLSGGHFRMINEKLYTCTGIEALHYFKEDPALFNVYHAGYQEQMSHWPEQPVNIIIKWLKDHSSSFAVADFGCGDARLAKSVKNKVFSFDLVSNDPSVVACAMSNIRRLTSSIRVNDSKLDLEMGSCNGYYSAGEFDFDTKWLIDPKHLFVGPKIGEGAHAKVYEGKYKNQNVAVKVVHKGETPEEISKREARFAREISMLSRVQHKNLVKFIGACKKPVMVIVTELLLGGTLRKYLLNMRPRCLEMPVAVGFALDIARGMECLHSHGIIHRDLKPENLILTLDHTTVKLADFGLAREESVTEMMTAETGTYRWMAPELYSTVTLRHGEKKHYNHKVDVYSFAIVLWELIHNKLPFEGMSNLQAAYAAAFKNTRPNAENLPVDLGSIVTSCWEEDPNSRPNFTQIIQKLLHYFSSISPPEPIIPPRLRTLENAVLPPESPGTSSLMAARDDSADAASNKMEVKSKGFFLCFNQCY